ncbi:hypothetical protein A3F65_02225 [Candidatus Saccharibacteria bacterium RIFCSPHIGHO2_12_FULL_47_16b]|nr:MAG: hypothetical protein A3F65_02225 [Candidatus Saccharibacteria bacterium RIFCSPHIGHO2_12_FULL_47_16b]OGL38941.1 MAG: hypothetical protein A3J32_00260 [Candidatus Saccharibacteria bacterium RIFCSPLOWO2_02_FULL_46_7]
MNYSQLKSGSDWLALMKSFYFPTADKIEELKIPKMQFLSVSGKGAPTSEVFHKAIQSLYGLAFGLKMGLKFGKIDKPTGYFDYKMPALEGLWWQSGGWDMASPEKWQWRLLIMQPPFVTEQLFDEAKTQAKQKHPEIPYDKVRLEDFEEGSSIQTLHVGPYDKEQATIERLMDYAKAAGYKIAGHHHEIYMGDPRRTKPERLKTVLRYHITEKR